MRSSLRRRASVVLARFLITFCIGVAATLAWQSYGDAARGKIASSSPQLGGFAPQAAPVAQAPPVAQTAPAQSAGASPDQIKAISQSLAVVRQSVDRLAAEITRLQATKQDGLDRTSAPPPAPARKPVPLQAQPGR
jgi:hypothetical protein